MGVKEKAVLPKALSPKEKEAINALEHIKQVYGWVIAEKLWSDTNGFKANNLKELIAGILKGKPAPLRTVISAFNVLENFYDDNKMVPAYFMSLVDRKNRL
jgi:hypothetical protein